MATVGAGRLALGRGPGLAPTLASLRGRLTDSPYHWQALVVIVPGAFMVSLNMTVVIVALPRIIQVLQTTVDQGQFVMTAYLTALAVAMPVTAYAADTFGAKRTYLVSIGLFTAGSALCVVAPGIEALIFFRVLQGMGGAMIMPLGMSMLLQATPPRQRGTVMGLYGFPMLLAPVVGPILGGLLVEVMGWRPIFAMVLPVGVVAILLGALILRETPKRAGARFDWAGFVLAAIGCSAALLALSKAPNDGWLAPHVVALWLIMAAAIPSWVVVELTQKEPMLDLRVLRDRTYAISTLVSVLAMIVLFSTYLLLPLFLQNVRGLSPLQTGLLIVPEALAAAVMMPFAGRLLDRFGPRPLIIPGLLAFAVSSFMLSRIDLGLPDSTLRLILVLKGLAMGCTFMPITTTAMDSIPAALISRGSVLLNVVRQVTGAFGTAVFTSLLIERTNFHQASLAQQVNSASLAIVQMLSASSLALVQQGVDERAAELISLSTLAKQASQTASVRAYDDCFYVAAVISIFAAVPVLFIRRAHRS